MTMTIKSRVLNELERFYHNNKSDYLTATEISNRTGDRLDSVSGILCRLYQEGQIERIDNFGPRGGYGYRYKSK